MKKFLIVLSLSFITFSLTGCGLSKDNKDKKEVYKDEVRLGADINTDIADEKGEDTIKNDSQGELENHKEDNHEDGDFRTQEPLLDDQQFKNKYKPYHYGQTKFAQIYSKEEGFDYVSVFSMEGNSFYKMLMTEGYPEYHDFGKIATLDHYFSISNNRLFTCDLVGELISIDLDEIEGFTFRDENYLSHSSVNLISPSTDRDYAIDDKYVYYSELVGNGKNILRKDIVNPGKAEKLLFMDEVSLEIIFAKDESLFIVYRDWADGNIHLKRINRRSGKEEGKVILIDKSKHIDPQLTSAIMKDDTWIYSVHEVYDGAYCDNLYEVNLKTLKNKLLLPADGSIQGYCNLEFSGDWIYYTNKLNSPKDLYRMKSDFTEKEHILYETSDFYVSEDFIYLDYKDGFYTIEHDELHDFLKYN